MKLRVMSFNVQHFQNYITRQIDYEMFADTIRSLNPDIVGLNEVYSDGPRVDYVHQVQRVADALGYHFYFAQATVLHNGSHYGNGVLSRYPLMEAETIPIPDPENPAYDGYYETRCVLRARVDIAGGLTVLISHFGLNPDEQENAVRTLASNLGDRKTIAMGDFNVTPENPVLTPIREKMRDTADLYAEPLLSFPTDEPNCKIDYVFCTSDFRIHHADIPALVVSDHRPYVVDLEI